MILDRLVRVLILADVRSHREALAQALAHFGGVDVVAVAPLDQSGLDAVVGERPDVVLVNGATVSGTSDIVQQIARHTGAPVVAYGVADQEVIRYAEAGVVGFVSREASLEELVAAILRVSHGGVACPPPLSTLLLRQLAAAAAQSRSGSPDARLTLRERQVLALLEEGLANKEIATRLGVAVSTIKNHVHHVLQKLGAKRRGEAAARARRVLPGWSSGRSGVFVGWLALLGALTSLGAACSDPVPPLPCTATLGERCWVYLGPDYVQVTAVAEVEGNLWIGTATQGILRYDAREHAWREVAFPGKAVRSIVVVPSTGAIWTTLNGAVYRDRDPDTTFSYLYLSTNRGRTWQPRDGGMAAERHFYPAVGPFAMDPSNPKRLLLGGGWGIALSEDGGATWQKVLGEPNTLLSYDAVAVSPANSQRVWAGGSNTFLAEQFAFRSDNGGHTWTAVSQPGPSGYGTVGVLLPHPKDPNVALAAIYGSLQWTRDGGASWWSVLELAHHGRYVYAFAMSDTMLVAVSDEWLSDWVPGVLGLYTAPALEGPWTVVPTPPDAAAGLSVMVDDHGQIVIGTERGVWLVRN